MALVAAPLVALLLFVFIVVLLASRRRARGLGGRLGGVVAEAPGSASAATASGLLTEQQVESWGRPAPGAIELRGGLLPGSADQVFAGQPSETVESGLAAIRAHDPAFDLPAFLAQAQSAFFVVEDAWTQLRPETSRRVMADGLWAQHKVRIEQYESEHRRNVLDDLAVGAATVRSAHTDACYDTIVVRFLAACADYDIDTRTDKTVRGHRKQQQWEEDWTFQRSSRATTKAGGGTLSSKCPNCGAPLKVDLAGVCEYCKASIMSGEYDWVLCRIAEVD